jgi:uncharacterized protein (DUF2147 family)
MPGCSSLFRREANKKRTRRERRIWPLLLLLLAAAAPEGDWLTQDAEGVIRIAPCGQALCGRIIGVLEPAHDVQGRPQCGLEIIHLLKPDGTGTWHGRITDPETGRVYNARITPRDETTITLRGALDVPLLRDIFGSTQIWTRHTGPIGENCQMKKQPPGKKPGG